MIETITVRYPGGSYDVTVREGGINHVSELFKLDRKVLIVTDDGVPKEYSEKVASACKEGHIFTFTAGESSKNPSTYLDILKELMNLGFTRTDALVSVGGGVVSDLTGFAASTYMRGVDFYCVPTTLLSQVDASVGGKTGIDLDGVKNIVGTFCQPKGVIIDTDLLGTLDTRQFSNGMAEAIKTALLFDSELFDDIKNYDGNGISSIVARCVKHKAEIVEKDEKEKGLRRSLNFGHTLGHAIETLTGLYHGEAVSVGMCRMCTMEVYKELVPVLDKFGLPKSADVDYDKVFELITHDKKADGDSINIVIVPKIGEYEIRNIKISDFNNIVKESLYEEQ